MESFRERYGPWALVTGASAGLGAEFARQLAAKRINLILVARRKERLETLASELEGQYNVEVKAIAADLARSDFMSSIRPVLQTLELGLLVNNAGFGLVGNFLENDLERELEMLNVNCRAPLILAHEVGRQMVERKRGGIIFVSSTSGFTVTPFMTHYAASKAYDLFLGEGLWSELKEHGVDVLALCPGGTRTEFHELAGIKPFGAMPVEPVVSLALRKLGKKISVIAGWHNRVMVYLAGHSLRRINATIAAGIIRKRTDRF